MKDDFWEMGDLTLCLRKSMNARPDLISSSSALDYSVFGAIFILNIF